MPPHGVRSLLRPNSSSSFRAHHHHLRRLCRLKTSRRPARLLLQAQLDEIDADVGRGQVTGISPSLASSEQQRRSSPSPRTVRLAAAASKLASTTTPAFIGSEHNPWLKPLIGVRSGLRSSARAGVIDYQRSSHPESLHVMSCKEQQHKYTCMHGPCTKTSNVHYVHQWHACAVHNIEITVPAILRPAYGRRSQPPVRRRGLGHLATHDRLPTCRSHP